MLTGNDNARVHGAPLHGFVRGVGDGEDVRRSLVHLATLVLVDVLLAEYVQRLVRVHGNDDLTDIRVDLSFLIAAAVTPSTQVSK